MWTLHTDSGNSIYGGQNAKNIYLGETRILTKLAGADETTAHEEINRQYYYHSDHLGSASLITDHKGEEYERLEYTPYGELWVDKKSTVNTGLEYIPYRFTGKEMDPETGLYYYGARYLDPKYSRWLSADPALSYYVECKSNGSSGGIYNPINLNLYHYGANNPVRYTDPTGMEEWDETKTTCTITSNDKLWKITENFNKEHGTNISYDDVAKVNDISDPNKIFIGDKLDFGEFIPKDTSSNENPTYSNFPNKDCNSYSIKENLGLFESMFNTIGLFSFIGGKFASKIPNYSGLSKNLYALSDKLGYISLGIDIYQFIDNPNLQNSRNLLVTSIGINDPFLGIFLSSYYNYQDTVNELINPKPTLIHGSGIIDTSKLGRGSLW